MRKALMVGGLVLGLGMALATRDALAKDMAGWVVEGSGTGIVEGQKYSIKNLDQGGYLRYQDRTGANFGWTGNANQAMQVKRKTAGSGPIKCGEVFALFIEKEWMIHDSQRFGINISSRTQLNKDEYYQWKFTGCKDGDVVPLHANVTLTNTVTNDSLVGCKRAIGVNMCWADDTATVRGKVYRKADVPH